MWYAEFLKNRCNTVDGTFYDDINIVLSLFDTIGYIYFHLNAKAF